MANVKLDDSTLVKIADKIREKNKETASYKPSEMPDAIDRIKVTEVITEPLTVTANGIYTATGEINGYTPITVNVPADVKSIDITDNGTYTATDCDGYNVINVNTPMPPEEAFIITGVCLYRFANKGWDWFIEKYGDSVVTREITNMSSMFNASAVKEIPFVLNVNNINVLRDCFTNTLQLNKCPKIRGTINWTTSTDLSDMLTGCVSVRDFGDLFTDEMLNGYSEVKVTSQYSVPKCVTFEYCKSLRTVPSWWYQFRLNEESTAFPNTTYTPYNTCFNYCFALDEAKNIPVWRCSTPQTSNMFNSVVSYCGRLKQFTFERDENSLPIVVEWKGQIIDFTNYVGYGYSSSDKPSNYNSGITADKEVKDDATYQALKDDPDWFTSKIEYSRYNYTSAVNTINSLPDTSAYLLRAGGTNTIKFNKNAGSKTDGGSFSTHTEDEVAALSQKALDKGWTVAL